MCTVHPILGWPIVTAANCFEVIRTSGIKPWPMITSPVEVSTFLRDATASELKDYERFAPKVLAVKHSNPFDESEFNAFRISFKPYSLVILLVDGYVAVTAEWKHGNDRITIVPVCGVASKEESHYVDLHEKMKQAAIREVKEETGLSIASIAPLSSKSGMYSAVRNANIQCFPFFGTVEPFSTKGNTKFDSTEHLVMLLFSVEEWMKLIETHSLFDSNEDFGLEDATRSATYAAMKHIGRLSFT